MAQRLCDYLQTQSIDAKTDPDQGTGPSYPIWIREERDVQQARLILNDFEASPGDSRFDVASEAEKIRRQREKETQQKLALQQKARLRLRGGSGGWGGRSAMTGAIPVTLAVIVISTLISFLTSFAQPRGLSEVEQLRRLALSPNEVPLSSEQKLFHALSCVDLVEYRLSRDPWDPQKSDPFISLKQGELWRLITPMFLHGSPMHLVFNMMALFTLGSVVERLHGSRFLVVLLLVSQIGATLLQMMIPMFPFLAVLGTNPIGVGASGAVFGVFGYLWIRPRVQPNYPVEIPQLNVILMLGFLVACMTPLIPGIANGAHVGGLATGVAIALLWKRD